MRNRSRAVIALLLVVIATGLIWLVLHGREPVYQGKSLTAWCDQYGSNHWSANQTIGKEAETAIRNIGTNALPFLMKMMSAQESALKIKLLTHIPKSWRTRLHLPGVNDYKHELAERRRRGAHGLVALGAVAEPTVPALIAQLQDKEPDVRYVAVFALRSLGPIAKDALPALITCLNDPEFTVKDDAVLGLGTLEPKPEQVVPALIDFLQKNSKNVILCQDAMTSLGIFREKAKPAVPVLIEFLDNEQASIRSDATNALKLIDPEAAAKADIK
ncbi:MAG: repeat protein [Pedosphaera sp.]|nr:repeat protein [Pedosphaera sp.]